jgi:hypothetical protein
MTFLDHIAEVAGAIRGEIPTVVSFRGVSLTCNVNERPTESWKDGRLTRGVSFMAAGFSSVDIMAADVTLAPKAGEIMTEATGRTHRIQEVSPCGVVYRCLCAVRPA